MKPSSSFRRFAQICALGLPLVLAGCQSDATVSASSGTVAKTPAPTATPVVVNPVAPVPVAPVVPVARPADPVIEDLSRVDPNRYVVAAFTTDIGSPGYTTWKTERPLGAGFDTKAARVTTRCFVGNLSDVPVDNAVRFRLERLTLNPDDLSAIALRVSVTLVNMKVRLSDVKPARTRAAENCQDQYLSELSLGGSWTILTQYQPRHRKSARAKFLTALPAVLEVSDSPAERAYFDSVLKAYQDQLGAEHVAMRVNEVLSHLKGDSAPASFLKGRTFVDKMASLNVDALLRYRDHFVKSEAGNADGWDLGQAVYVNTQPAATLARAQL